MVNDDTLIKVLRNKGHKEDWPSAVRAVRKRLNEMKLGFPGIGDDHISLVEFGELIEGDVFIWDLYITSQVRSGDEAPIMLRLVGNGNSLIEGIGKGLDLTRDPDRLKYRWNDIIPTPNLDMKSLVWKVNVKPDLIEGGPGYYYFYKSYRDFRWPTRPSED